MALESSYIKFNWARELIDLFESDVKRHLGDENYQAVMEPQVFMSNGNSRVPIILKIIQEAPVDIFSVRAGDIVHNLRSALNHAIFEISLNHSTGIAIKNQRSLQFPICDSEEDFERDLKRGVIENHPKEAIEYIRSLQPFSNSEGTLSELRQISNADKHRTIQMTLISLPYITRTIITYSGGWGPNLFERLLIKCLGPKFVSGTRTRSKTIPLDLPENPEGDKLVPLENGSSLGGMLFGGEYDRNLPTMAFDLHLKLVFEQGPLQNKEVVPFLKNCSTEVEGILDSLKSFA